PRGEDVRNQASGPERPRGGDLRLPRPQRLRQDYYDPPRLGTGPPTRRPHYGAGRRHPRTRAARARTRGVRARAAASRSRPHRPRDPRVSGGVLSDMGLAVGRAAAAPVRAAGAATIRPPIQRSKREVDDAARAGAAAGAAAARRADRRTRPGGAAGRAVGIARLRLAAPG